LQSATQGTNQGSVRARIIEGMWQHFAATYNAGELGCIHMTCKPAYMQLFLDGLLVDSFTFTHDAGLLHRHFSLSRLDVKSFKVH
jgi:hypothetical protein